VGAVGGRELAGAVEAIWGARMENAQECSTSLSPLSRAPCSFSRALRLHSRFS